MKRKIQLTSLLLITGFLFLLFAPSLVPVRAPMDLAKGRAYIDSVEWQNNPPGSYAFEIYMDVKYVRNGLSYKGPAYLIDSGYDDSGYSTVSTGKLEETSGTDTTNRFVDESFIRRGTDSSIDGCYARFRLQKWGKWFGIWIPEGFETILDWGVYFESSGTTDWICDGKINIGYNLLITDD